MEKRPMPAFTSELKELVVKRVPDVQTISATVKELGSFAMLALL